MIIFDTQYHKKFGTTITIRDLKICIEDEYRGRNFKSQTKDALMAKISALQEMKLVTNNGESIEVGDSLEGQSYADQIREQMLTDFGLPWNADTLEGQEENRKVPLPAWLRSSGKILSKIFRYAFFIAFLYDMYGYFPEINEFFRKILS